MSDMSDQIKNYFTEIFGLNNSHKRDKFLSRLSKKDRARIVKHIKSLSSRNEGVTI